MARTIMHESVRPDPSAVFQRPKRRLAKPRLATYISSRGMIWVWARSNTSLPSRRASSRSMM